MITLTALRPILFRSTQYEVGDALPGDDAATVEAWLEAGSAAMIDDEAAAKPAKAKRRSAPSGLTGKSSDGDPEALVGKLPDTPERKRKRKKA